MEKQGYSPFFSSFSVPPPLPRQRKQQELGDLMDLSSYLLRPIQRISKYSLLLQDVLTLAGSPRPKGPSREPLLSPGVYVPDLTSSERERERAEIQAAADLVQFQMRHGNDLLTMDAIRECDVSTEKHLYMLKGNKVTLRGVFLPLGEFKGAGSAGSPGRVHSFL